MFSAIALFALINGCLLNLVMASRLMYGMANERRRPEGARPRAHGPPHAVGGDHLHRLDRAVLVILGDLTTLADTTVLLLLFVFIGVHVSLIMLRKEPVDHDHFRAPTRAAVAGRADLRSGSRSSRSSTIPKLVLWAGGLLLFGLILWFDREGRAMID